MPVGYQKLKNYSSKITNAIVSFNKIGRFCKFDAFQKYPNQFQILRGSSIALVVFLSIILIPIVTHLIWIVLNKRNVALDGAEA